MANLWTLAQVFGRSACEHPDHTAVVAGASRLSYAQVDARSSSLAAGMTELGPRAKVPAPAGRGVSRLHRRAVRRHQLPQDFEDVWPELPDLQYLVTVGDEELWYDDRIFRFEDLVSSGEGRQCPEPSSAGDDSDLALLYTSGTNGQAKRRACRIAPSTAYRRCSTC